MATRSVKAMPPDAELFTGPRGGIYYIKDGKKLYLEEGKKAMSYKKKRKIKYSAPRGAFARYLANVS